MAMKCYKYFIQRNAERYHKNKKALENKE
jgi:hypothetical protein